VISAGRIVIVDVGNSAIKVAVANASGADGLLFHQAFLLDQPGWADRICHWVGEKIAEQAFTWWVSTVNRAASRPLQEASLLAFPRSDWRVLCHQDVPMRVEVEHRDRLGIDRFVGAYAASNRYPAPLVVVDAGSAVTVDWVRKDDSGRPVFAGGAILPGIRLQHAVLATGTEGLQPEKEGRQGTGLSVPGLAPATNTEQAIRLGVIASVTGAIDRLAKEYALAERALAMDDNLGPLEDPLVVLSGGDGPIISAYLQAQHVLVPHLVSLGLLELAARECQSAPGGLK
jgi:type III pantothenate kinase